MEDVFAAVNERPKRRQGITGQTIEAQMRGTMCQITEYELDTLRDEISRLTVERDQALARLAVHAATKPMVDAAFNALPPDACGMIGSGEMYRVLDAALKAEPPADAQASLDKMLAEARLEGWRAGREAAADEAHSCTHDPYVVRAIRALPEPEGNNHE